MPDMEPITDSLKNNPGRCPAQREWERGFQAGKKQARIEVGLIMATLYFAMALLGVLISA